MTKRGIIVGLLLLLSCAVRSEAQIVLGEDYRVPVRIVRPDSTDGVYVWYKVIRSDLTPQTVGRRYRSGVSTFTTNFLAVESGTRMGFLLEGVTRVWRNITWDTIYTDPGDNVRSCLYGFDALTAIWKTADFCPDPPLPIKN
jgi:hypothetical protein